MGTILWLWGITEVVMEVVEGRTRHLKQLGTAIMLVGATVCGLFEREKKCRKSIGSSSGAAFVYNTIASRALA